MAFKFAPLRPLLLGALLVSTLLVSTPLWSAGGATAPDAVTAAPTPLDPVSTPEWVDDMARFAAQDRATPPPKHPVVFTGSSSIRLWEALASDFPALPVLNRGFGGSQLRDAVWYADQLVVRYRPRRVVLYSGDNDIAMGRTPQQVAADFRAFVARVRRDLPRVRIVFVSLKPSPARAQLLPLTREANALIRADIAGMRGVDYVDVFTPMLGADGQPRPDLFVADRLHMNRAGYALWRDAIAPHLR